MSAFLAGRVDDPVPHLHLHLESGIPLASRGSSVLLWYSELRLDPRSAAGVTGDVELQAEQITIGSAQLLTVDIDDADALPGLLAARAHLSPYAALFDADGRIAHPMELDIGGAVIVTELAVERPWRRKGLGPLYLLTLLEELGRGRGVAAAWIGPEPRPAHHEERRVLHQLLTRAGFSPVTGELYAMDLTAERHTVLRHRMLEQYRRPRRAFNLRRRR